MSPPEAAASILELTAQLVRIPSRAGVDAYAPIIDAVRRWLDVRSIGCTVLHSKDGGPIGLCASVPGRGDGPCIMLNATLDTADFGDESKWRDPPTSAHIRAGWLYGRGAADSKGGAALFCHLLAEHAQLLKKSRSTGGTLVLLLDLDEHTGGFAGVKQYFAEGSSLPRPGGVYIGYPGNDRIVTGGRGFLRARLTVHGRSAHSGSSGNRGVNAVLRAAHVAQSLSELRFPADNNDFPIAPQLTVTRIEGGESYSLVPDRCEIDLDIRLTPMFTDGDARRAIASCLQSFDSGQPDVHRTEIQWHPGWPAYCLPADTPVLTALSQAARKELGSAPQQGVAGPSNIGNFLASLGIPAVSGFGFTYRGIHASDECIEIASIDPVYRVYQRALETLFA